MNKQEKEELISFVKKTEKDLNFKFGNRLGSYSKTRRGYIRGKDLINYVEQLDEPQEIKVPEEFDEWYQQIKSHWTNESSAKQFALWKICQFGFGKGFEGLKHERASINLSRWVSAHQEDAINAIWNGYEVEEEPKWVVNEGDLVIRKGEHEAKVYFVESVDEDGILLVNGFKDEFFTNSSERSIDEEPISYFYKNFRLLVKKDNLEVEEE